MTDVKVLTAHGYNRHNSVYSICSFDPLLDVHMILESYLAIPFFALFKLPMSVGNLFIKIKSNLLEMLLRF